MPSFTDQLDRIVSLPHFPRRIISLVPSQTELLCSLGLGEQVVGITKFCVHPDSWFRTKTRIGGTKDIHPDIIASLNPDLIIANKEENQQDQVEALFPHYPVWISDVHDLPSALGMIRSIGHLTGTLPMGENIARQIEKSFAALSPQKSPPRTAYFIWRNPYMVAGGDTFIHDMLTRAGFENVFANYTRYPAIPLEALEDLGCDLVLLSSEPYPFKERHIDEIRTALPHTAIRLVDGELFSWYGSRLLHAPAYFGQLHKNPQSAQNIDL